MFAIRRFIIDCNKFQSISFIHSTWNVGILIAFWKDEKVFMIRFALLCNKIYVKVHGKFESSKKKENVFAFFRVENVD